MAPLDIIWKRRVSHHHNEHTNTLVSVSRVYVAAAGKVLRVDCWTGEVIKSNNLNGTGYHEVRLAASEDASLLVAGTHGYVVDPDAISLGTKWSVSLPGTSYYVTSVICVNGSAYAGSYGRVFRLDPANGKIVHTNSLSGYGSHEVRLGVTHDVSTLLVGINGHALGMDINTLKINWQNDMPDSGYDTISVLGGSQVGYAACRGRVYRIDEHTGSTLNQNDLFGTGSHEVRMTLDSGGTQLYVGTNGYGIGLRPENLETIYSVSLPGSGYSVTDVTAGLQTAYYANSGCVSQLDNGTGNVVASNPLPGLGMHVPRLSTDLQGTESLFIGLTGRVIALGLTDHPSAVSRTDSVGSARTLVDQSGAREGGAREGEYEPAGILFSDKRIGDSNDCFRSSEGVSINVAK
ncbi:hypothetical protein MMC29_001330 [Sticta canariensis]|nr:hypothetical protein [Sticta canariensis]